MSLAKPNQQSKFKTNKKTIVGVVVVIVLAAVGARLLTLSHAQTPYASASAPTGRITSPASIKVDSTASSGSSVQFGSAPSITSPTQADLTDALAMLNNETNHGWTTCFESGAGLSINWDELNGKTVYDWNGTGQPDPCPAPYATRHEDRMTTLRFLHALLLYKADTGSTHFDSEISTIEAHVLTLFTTANPDQRGWAYDEFTDIAKLSGNSQFTAIANSMLALYAKSPFGNTRPDYQFEEASALVQSGVPAYVSQGQAELNSYWNSEYISGIQLISEPTEIQSSDNGDIAIALARAGMITQAQDIIQGMQKYLWDPTYGGYYEGATYTNGVLSTKDKKTGGRSMAMLELGKILNDKTMITQMDNIFHQHIYQASPTGYEGVLYEQQPNWQPYVLGGTTENWVTSEAMGIAMIALLIQ